MVFQKSACIEPMYSELPFLERFQAAKDDGFEFAEFWSWTDKDLDAVKAAAEKVGIGIAGFNGSTEIKFASDQHYSVSLQRRYGSWDWNNWNGKVSFSDEIVLRDDMPVCQPDPDLEYYGFLSTGLCLVDRKSVV